ncbi:MAG: hypothetical protein N3A69_15060, partial [Leptospiraceae bacterium]|nr:hypothetical protein [Leptospiraceae bacterium]
MDLQKLNVKSNHKIIKQYCVFDDDLSKPQNLVDLLKLFFNYTPPAYEQWEIASNEFKERIPEIGNFLLEIIEKERKINPTFIQAFQR